MKKDPAPIKDPAKTYTRSLAHSQMPKTNTPSPPMPQPDHSPLHTLSTFPVFNGSGTVTAASHYSPTMPDYPLLYTQSTNLTLTSAPASTAAPSAAAPSAAAPSTAAPSTAAPATAAPPPISPRANRPPNPPLSNISQIYLASSTPPSPLYVPPSYLPPPTASKPPCACETKEKPICKIEYGGQVGSNKVPTCRGSQQI